MEDRSSQQALMICFCRYPTTKLLEIYAVRELASLLPVSESGVIINTVSPGLCYSNLDRNASLMLRLALAVMRLLLARSTEKGSRNLLQAAFAGPDSHGTYCSECQVKEYVPRPLFPLLPALHFWLFSTCSSTGGRDDLHVLS